MNPDLVGSGTFSWNCFGSGSLHSFVICDTLVQKSSDLESELYIVTSGFRSGINQSGFTTLQKFQKLSVIVYF